MSKFHVTETRWVTYEFEAKDADEARKRYMECEDLGEHFVDDELSNLEAEINEVNDMGTKK